MKLPHTVAYKCQLFASNVSSNKLGNFSSFYCLQFRKKLFHECYECHLVWIQIQLVVNFITKDKSCTNTGTDFTLHYIVQQTTG